MAKKPKDDEMVSLNVRVPLDLKRRIIIAHANTRRPIQEIIAGVLDEALDRMGIPRLDPPPPAKKR